MDGQTEERCVVKNQHNIINNIAWDTLGSCAVALEKTSTHCVLLLPLSPFEDSLADSSKT